MFASKYEVENFSLIPESPFENSMEEVGSSIEEKANNFSETLAALNENSVEKIIPLYSLNKSALWILEEEISSSTAREELGFSEAPVINSNYEILFSVLKNYINKSFDVIVTSENEIQSNRLKELLSEFKKELAILIENGKIKIETLAIKEGFLHKEKKLLLLTDYQIFNKPYRAKVPSKRKYKISKSRAFASMKKGDYVVHEDYGIGKFIGLETIQIGEAKQESMKLLYKDDGVVYVNLNYLTLVKKYSSNENLKPALSTLGTNDWTNTKRKTK